MSEPIVQATAVSGVGSPRVAITVPTRGTQHYDCWMPLVETASRRTHGPRMLVVRSHQLTDESRNSMIREVLRIPTVEWVLMVDDDITHLSDVDVVDELIQSATRAGVSIAVGQVPFRRTEHGVTINVFSDEFLRDGGDIAPAVWLAQDSFVDFAGTACMLVKREVFERMPEPWFLSAEHNGRWPGEDITFCKRAVNHGFKIVASAAVRLGHKSWVDLYGYVSHTPVNDTHKQLAALLNPNRGVGIASDPRYRIPFDDRDTELEYTLLLASIVNAAKPRVIWEIGSFIGGTTASLGVAAHAYGGYVVSFEPHKERRDMAELRCTGLPVTFRELVPCESTCSDQPALDKPNLVFEDGGPLDSSRVPRIEKLIASGWIGPDTLVAVHDVTLDVNIPDAWPGIVLPGSRGLWLGYPARVRV